MLPRFLQPHVWWSQGPQGIKTGQKVSLSTTQEKCLLSDDIMDYWYVSQGKITVPSIDDREDMQFANEAFDILGFTEEEK